MQRDTLIHQHGPYSQTVADYDRQKSIERDRNWTGSDSFQTQLRYPGGGTSSAGGNGGAALAVLVLGFIGLALLAPVLEAIFVELRLAWEVTLSAIQRLGHAGSWLIITSLALSGFALWSAASLSAAVRETSIIARAFAGLLLWVPGLLVLVVIGRLVAAVPGLGVVTERLVDGLVRAIPPPPGSAYPASGPFLVIGSVSVLLGIPALRMAFLALFWSLVQGTAQVLALRQWLTAKGLCWPAGVVSATVLLYGLMQLPTPPAAVPFGIWPHPAMIVGLIFGWRVAPPAAVLAILPEFYGLPRTAAGEPDFSLVGALWHWWAVFIASAGVAGWARSARFRSFGRELGTMMIALGAGLVAGWLVLLFQDALANDSVLIKWDTRIYWTTALPRYMLGYVAAVAIATVAGAALRVAAMALVGRAQEAGLRRSATA